MSIAQRVIYNSTYCSINYSLFPFFTDHHKFTIKALIFDCFGVFYPDPVFTYMKYPKTPPEKARTPHSLDEQAVRGKLSKNTFINQAAILLNKPELDIEIQFFHRHSTYKQLIDFVKHIRADYKTALLSNIGKDMMDAFFTPEELHELYDVTILSGNEGFAKLDKEIFTLTCQRLKLPPQEKILIDDVQKYCNVAKSFDLQTICYEDFSQFHREITSLLK